MISSAEAHDEAGEEEEEQEQHEEAEWSKTNSEERERGKGEEGQVRDQNNVLEPLLYAGAQEQKGMKRFEQHRYRLESATDSLLLISTSLSLSFSL